ncbi:FAD:protein FMN transferase [Pseudonocardia endophytica]|uniref:FAD:protein FMN transferase n=1 Tax=Pseudonocardia endophytica TaxID=401976 RepID=A0A4V2PI25_PSEEN|nr:FAD:protein FMN transferase [Pseudonocardia endophytica]TCK22956.1 thiamine biosynthesis lipoprotein [Pseudonocardia endophytica]
MTLLETLPPVPGSTQWPLWSTTARIVVADAGELDRARLIVDEHTRAVERACSRFTDSEVTRLPDDGRPVRVSALLGNLVTEALRAAERTGGDVDPTLGRPLSALGYDRDFTLVPRVAGRLTGPPPEPVPGWRRIRVEPDGPDAAWLTVPPGVLLDLGATAKAWCADRCAADVAGICGTGVLVALGGDVATAGRSAGGGWDVLVQDGPDAPGTTVRIADGDAVATSSTTSRRWTRGRQVLHHVLDPRRGTPADPVWDTVTVAARTCVEANTLSTAAIVRGLEAVPWLRELGVPARLVSRSGRIVTAGSWPA